MWKEVVSMKTYFREETCASVCLWECIRAWRHLKYFFLKKLTLWAVGQMNYEFYYEWKEKMETWIAQMEEELDGIQHKIIQI